MAALELWNKGRTGRPPLCWLSGNLKRVVSEAILLFVLFLLFSCYFLSDLVIAIILIAFNLPIDILALVYVA